MILDLAMSFAKSKAATIAQKIGRSEKDVANVIDQAPQLLSGVQKHGLGILSMLGIGKDWIQQMYQSHGSKLSLIPGISQEMVDREYGNIISYMSGTAAPPTPKSKKQGGGFNKSNYPRV